MTQELLRALAEARVILEHKKEWVAECQADLERSEAYADLVGAKEWRGELQERVDALALQVREKTLLVYGQDGNKKPCPGVQIKLYAMTEFDQQEARAWCLAHADSFMQLNTKAFTKAAKDLVGAPVTVTQEPRVTIARDLSEYLEVHDEQL